MVSVMRIDSFSDIKMKFLPVDLTAETLDDLVKPYAGILKGVSRKPMD